MNPLLVIDDAGLRDLEPPWRALWTRSAKRCPFRSPDWLLPWWSVFGTGRPVVAVSEHGLLASYLLEDKLLPIGVGLTDYQDVLLAADAPPGEAARLLGAVLETARELGARAFHFPDLAEDAALRPAPCPGGWRSSLTETDLAPVLALRPGADLRDAIGTGRARDVRQARHRAERAGGYSLSCGDEQDGFRCLQDLHARRWRSAGTSGVLDDQAVLAFHRIAVPRLVAAGSLSIPVLRIAGRPAAAAYVLRGPDRLYLYLSGYDPGLRFESPGTLLLGHLIEEALGSGLREVHFLRGDEAYKQAWGAAPRRNAMRAFEPA